jgi:mannosylglycoprotein endo-beta-mannosidase
VSEVERDALDRPLDLEELRRVLQKGGGNKAPGRVGICRAFFTETWEDLKEDWLELFSDMFERGRLLDQQKNGVIVCIPKTRSPKGPRDYRPITLLNTDYKIFARILAGRVQSVLGDV